MAEIKQKKLLQLLRSSVYETKAAAVTAIKAITFENASFDGAPLAVRYTTGTSVETLFVIFHNVDSKTGYTIFDSATDGVLKETSYDKTTGILTLTFQLADGTTKDVQVDLKEMLDIDDVVIGSGSTNYLKVTLGASGETGENMVLDTKIGTVAKPAIYYADAEEYNAAHPEADPITEEEFEELPDEEKIKTPAVPAETGLADAEDVSEAIADEVARLEEEIEELQANSLTGVSVNGLEAEYDKEGDTTHVAVVINGDDIEVASAYTEVEYAEEFAEKEGVSAVTAEDKISEALAKVEGTVKVLVDEVLDNEEVSEKAIEALANAAGVLDADGVIVYTVHEDDSILSAATNLDSADVALADAIRKVEAKSATVVDALPEVGNSETLGANVTSEVDTETNATTYFVDVNFDFGTF